MPSHPERVRTASLPEGYQFGDAGKQLGVAIEVWKNFAWRDVPQFGPGARDFKVRLAKPAADCDCAEIAALFTKQYHGARIGEPPAGKHYVGCASNKPVGRFQRLKETVTDWGVLEEWEQS